MAQQKPRFFICHEDCVSMLKDFIFRLKELVFRLKALCFRLKDLASRLKHQEGNTGMPPSLPYATE